MSDPFQFTGRLRSFRHAFGGIAILLRSQHNAWIHAAATLVVVLAGVALRVSAQDWLWLILAMAAVWTAEAFNTAFEFLADATVPEFHPLVKKAKDVAAGAVLIAALGAAAIGTIIFVLRVLARMSGTT